MKRLYRIKALAICHTQKPTVLGNKSSINCDWETLPLLYNQLAIQSYVQKNFWLISPRMFASRRQISATHRRIHGHDDAKSSKIRTLMSLALKPFKMSLMRKESKHKLCWWQFFFQTAQQKSRRLDKTNALRKQVYENKQNYSIHSNEACWKVFKIM